MAGRYISNTNKEFTYCDLQEFKINKKKIKCQCNKYCDYHLTVSSTEIFLYFIEMKLVFFFKCYIHVHLTAKVVLFSN